MPNQKQEHSQTQRTIEVLSHNLSSKSCVISPLFESEHSFREIRPARRSRISHEAILRTELPTMMFCGLPPCAFPISTIESKPEPETVEEKEHHERGGKSCDGRLADFPHDDVEVA